MFLAPNQAHYDKFKRNYAAFLLCRMKLLRVYDYMIYNPDASKDFEFFDEGIDAVIDAIEKLDAEIKQRD